MSHTRPVVTHTEADCPMRSAFIDQLLGRKAGPPPESEPAPRRCRLESCGAVISSAKHADAEFCGRSCRYRHSYAKRGGARAAAAMKQKAAARPQRVLLAEAMALPADAELSPEHRHVLAGAFMDGPAEAVGARG